MDQTPQSPPSTSQSIAPNWTKPVPAPDPTQNFSGKPKRFANALPELRPYRTARPPQVADDQEPPPNFALEPTIPPPRRRPTDDDPFAPVGVDVGSLRLTPYAELDSGYDSNPGRTANGRLGSLSLRGEAGVSETSQWSNHALTTSLEAGYTDFARAPQFNRPDASLKSDLRIDASKETALDFELRGTLSTQLPGSPGLNATLVNSPLASTLGGTVGVTQTMSRWAFGLHALVDRGVYDNGKLSTGAVDPLSSQNYADYTVQARAAYEVTPGVSPFVEVDADDRVHDQRIDSSGYARNSTGFVEQIGTSFELTRILTGSVAAGYTERNYQDKRLAHIRAPTLSSSLIWQATPLTTVTLKGATTVSETTVTQASSELSRNLSLSASHALLRNFTLTGTGSYQVNTYPGSPIVEHDYLASVAAQYAFNRWLSIKLAYSHERLASSTPGASYSDDAVTLGLRVQR